MKRILQTLSVVGLFALSLSATQPGGDTATGQGLIGDKRPDKTFRSNINQMSAEDFQRLGLPAATAGEVTRYREEHGKFSSVDDLKNVPGVKSAWVDRHRQELNVV
ncbi:MAG: ComEA family DNA-binding protein [Bdellovibrionota bacterium]